MDVQSVKSKAFIGILSTILLSFGGYSVDTIVNLDSSIQQMSLKFNSVESRVSLLYRELDKGDRFTKKDAVKLMERLDRIEMRIDSIIQSNK